MISRKDFTYDRKGERDYAYRRGDRVPPMRLEPITPQPEPEEAPEEPQQAEQPSWTVCLPGLLLIIERDPRNATAQAALARMAELADRYEGLCE